MRKTLGTVSTFPLSLCLLSSANDFLSCVDPPLTLARTGGNEWYGKLPATLFEQFVLPTIAAEGTFQMSHP